MKKLLTLMITLFALAAGCQSDNETKKTDSSQPIQQLSNGELNDQNVSKQAEEVLQKKNHLQDLQAINDDKKLLIAAQVPHNERFQMKKIEKRLTEQAEKQFSGHNVTLSLDKKIHLEVEKLKQQLANGKINEKKLTTEINRIIKLSKEKT
ncbi:YhcN/YlaJ family sporulation lipoprotein [Halobacillus seohaensis]|uniref:YhcN/YlaJ family sporulation lipoprotein n=1 Tax=Halobacillus seohaensis TaxID=447421 RepID=A0ABW2EHA3_9BACI